jgi:uncharacterized membrane protein (UPF0127 family)
MFSSRSAVRLILLSLLICLAACGGSEAKHAVVLKSIEDRFAIKVGEHLVQMQLAAEPAEMQKGLMFVPSMGADEGMLFIYASPQQMNFWMHNTDLALDIGYFDASGELKEIYPMYPHDERTVASHGKNLQFGLEMNQGWFKQAGVRPGAHLDLAAVAEGLRARGIKPESVGLR